MSTALILSKGNSTDLASQLPPGLAEFAGEGTELVKGFCRPGRMKVMQSNRNAPYTDFEEGSVIVTPANMPIAANGEKFHIVPLLFFPEWCTVNPYQLKGSLKMIRERTLDPAHEIAAKSRDPDLRGADKCPENAKYFLKHKGYLNFICWIVNHPELNQLPVLASFSGGEYGRGQRMCDLIQMRKAPIWAQVFECRVPEEKRHSEAGDWYGIDVGSPTVEGMEPFVLDQDEQKILRAAHKELVQLHMRGAVVVDQEEAEADAADSAAAGSDKFG